MYYEIYQSGANALGGLLGAGGDWRWRLKAANHEIIASGQGYSSRAGCMHAIELMKSTTRATPVMPVAA